MALRVLKPLSDAALFRDYFNNFLTVEAFAAYYGFSIEQANRVIKIGKRNHESNVSRAKRKAAKCK